MEKHNNSSEKEKLFSKNLEELKEGEHEAAMEIQRAQKRREEIVASARSESLKMIEESQEEIAKEKEKRIARGIKEIEKDVAVIVDKAEKDADKLRKGAEPKKAALKMASTFFGG